MSGRRLRPALEAAHGDPALALPRRMGVVGTVPDTGGTLRRSRGRPRATVKREKLTVLFSEAVALRLRLHCDYTGSELSAFVERAVVAALNGNPEARGGSVGRRDVMRIK